MRIHELFKQARLEGRKLFIPYITCGDPDLRITEELVKALYAGGAAIIELGVPFSDPIADGVTNQRSAERALKNQVNLKACCDLVKSLREQRCEAPLVLFTYFNPILKFGMKGFAAMAAESGVDAVLVVDLPLEEAEEFFAILKQHQVGTILLLSPTTTAERIQDSNRLATEFLYYVSRLGVTGAQAELSASLQQELDFIRKNTSLPIAVGFGISTPEQAKQAAVNADAVVVGSALVKEMEARDPREGKKNMLKLASELMRNI